MNAIVWTKYGPPEVLQLKEVGKPVPKDNEVLVRIVATTITKGACELRSLKLPVYFSLPFRLWLGLRKPRENSILGSEFAGDIEAVGKNVTRYKEGDPVFGSSGLHFGTYAEYICLPEMPAGGVLAIKPASLSFEEAAVVPLGGIEALHFLRRGNIHTGQKVLINGAGGSIGTFAVQLAKYYGAEVTGVDSQGKLDMVRAIGADHVIDYTKEDFTRGGGTFDVIYDVIGKSPFSGSLRSLKKNGVYLLGNPGLIEMARGQWSSPGRGKKVIFGESRQKPEDLVFLQELIEAGEIKTVIGKRFPLEQTAEAHRYVEEGQAQGTVVINVR